MKYRILKKYLEDKKDLYYYPQYKFLFWWCNICNDNGIPVSCLSYEVAARTIDNYSITINFKDTASEYIPGTYEKETAQVKLIKIAGISEPIIACKNSKFETWKIDLFDDQVKKLEIVDEYE